MFGRQTVILQDCVMASRQEQTYLIQTKLYRPPLPPDLVARQFADPDSWKPLTLVCAPAGYGKSTLVAQWVEDSDLPVAWVSLDENDSDLRTFLNYFVAAIRQIFPSACEEATGVLEADNLPPAEIMAGRLSNDLDGIGDRFILVLDDFHRMRDSSVHQVLDLILEHPPRGMQLVIATRRNPSLSLQSMRGRDLLREVRLHDLRFTRKQTARFLEGASGKAPKPKTIQAIHEKTEGWPVALRLAAMAIRHQESSDAFIDGFHDSSVRLEEYLLSEVLDQQRPENREFLLRTSILQRFCAPLCDALCDPGGECRDPGSNGDVLIQALRETAMPCVPLDDVSEWYRLHHLFQEMLERRLVGSLTEQEVLALHCRAAHWLDEHGLVEEAIHHYLKAADPQGAARAVARHRQEAVNSEQWPRITTWLDTLPQVVVQEDAGLLMLLARLFEKQGRYLTCVETMDRAEELLSDPKHGGSDHDLYQAWLDQQRSIFAYHFIQPTVAIELATRALKHLPEECASERVYAKLCLAVSYQMTGEAKRGFKVVYDALERDGKTSRTSHSRLLQTLCWMHWIGGDLHSMEQAANLLLDVGRKSGFRETVIHGQYFLGAARYHLNRLDAAEESLTPPASDPFGPVFIMHMSASLALSLVHEALGRPVQARKTVDALVAHMLETGNTSHLYYAQAQQAEIAMRQGRFPEAVRWADEFDTGQAIAGYHFSFPDLVVARILVHQGTAPQVVRADELLHILQERFEATHNTRFTIETLAVRALLATNLGDEELAIRLLTDAIAMAQPGGFIRLFVDMGPTMSRLLNRVRGDEAMLTYVGEIQAAFRPDQPIAGPATLGTGRRSGYDSLQILSKRELEVLGFLAHQLTNREIGSELFISPETVKRHTKNIYQKLGVSGRIAAVAKATGLGILRNT